MLLTVAHKRSEQSNYFFGGKKCMCWPDHQTPWVPHPRRVFVFAARVGVEGSNLQLHGTRVIFSRQVRVECPHHARQPKTVPAHTDSDFLTFSCHARLPFLDTVKARDLFECVLETMRRRYVFFVFGYVVMPEHVHLLVSEPRRLTLDRAIQALKTSISKQSSPHPFWLVRYYDFNVWSEDKRVEKLRYMHRNPVARGLVNLPQEWKWSSFHHYLTGDPGNVEIESSWTVGRREGLKMPGEL
jgi:putative transposase